MAAPRAHRGFCGGYTAFSTFAQESLDSLQARDTAIAVSYVAASSILGIVAVLAGCQLGRLV